MKAAPGAIIRVARDCDSFVLSLEKDQFVTVEPPVQGIIVYKGNMDVLLPDEDKTISLPTHIDPYSRITLIGTRPYNEAIVLERTPPFSTKVARPGPVSATPFFSSEQRTRKPVQEKVPSVVEQRLKSDLWKAFVAKAKKDLVNAMLIFQEGTPEEKQVVIHDVTPTSRGSITLTVKEFPWSPEQRVGVWMAQYYESFKRYETEDKRWWFTAKVKRTHSKCLASIIPWRAKIFSDENEVREYLNTSVDL